MLAANAKTITCLDFFLALQNFFLITTSKHVLDIKYALGHCFSIITVEPQ